MTNYEIANRYVSSQGMMLDGGKNYLTPIFPFFILDAEYNIFTQGILQRHFTGKSKQIVERWRRAYNLANHDFFRPFTDDEREEIIDKMEDFHVFINNQLVAVKVAFMDAFPKQDFDKQTFIADCLLCNTLAQSAQCFWEKTWRNNRGKKVINHDIDTIRYCAKTLLNLNYKGDSIDCNENPKCVAAVTALINRIVKWVSKN